MAKAKKKDRKLSYIDYGQIPPQKYKLDKKELLYRYIENRYEPHIIAEAAANAIAKKRAKGPFSTSKAQRSLLLLLISRRKTTTKNTKKNCLRSQNPTNTLLQTIFTLHGRTLSEN